jgi:hypothetical protein
MTRADPPPSLGDVVTRLPVGELTWDDLVVDPSVRERFASLGDAVLAGGLVLVISGPTGVGKTFAARVWAESLRLDLWRVDVELLLERHRDGAAARGLDEVLAFGRRPLGVLVLDRPERLLATSGDTLLARLADRRAPTVLELGGEVPSTLSTLPAISLARPGRELRRRQWQRLVERASPLSAPDYGRLADLELTGATIDAAVRQVVLSAGDERLETDALVAAVAREPSG